MEKKIESVGDLLVETIELRETLLLKLFVSGKRPEKASGEWCVDLVEEFEKQQTDPISVGKEPITTRVWQFFNETLGAELP